MKIADFGLAKIRELQPTATTKTNVILGTPQYMAPEQYDNLKQADHRADIYSLGVVFYEMLTGRLPMGRFDPPSKRAAVDARLDPVVLKALEPDPARRYQRAVQVKTDVDLVRKGPAPKRLPKVWIAAAGLLAAVVVLLLTWPRPEPSKETPSRPAAPTGPADQRFAAMVSRLEKAKTIRAKFRTETRNLEGIAGTGTGEFLQQDMLSRKLEVDPGQISLVKDTQFNNESIQEIMLTIRIGGWDYGYHSKLYLKADGLPAKRTVSPQKGGKWVSYSEWFDSIEIDVPIDPSNFVVRG